MPEYWLLKSEPAVFGIDDLAACAEGIAGWDGVRQYQARRYLRQMSVGDGVLFYHSGVRPPGVAGLAEVVSAAYPDVTQFDSSSAAYDPRADEAAPRWWQVDVRYCQHLPAFVTLAQMRQDAVLSALPICRQPRLSVCPVSAQQWRRVLLLGAVDAVAGHKSE